MRISLPGHRHHAHDATAGHRHGHGVHSFEGRAEGYDRMARRLMRRPYRRIAADIVAHLPMNARVLDVGTGPGRLLVELARMRGDLRLTGVDPAADMIATARRNLSEFGERADAVVAGATDLPFEDGTFDLIVSTLSVHHWEDPAAGGRELARVRRTGGQIRVYDMRSAPFAELRSGVVGAVGRPDLERFPISPLPYPALRRLVL
jgi:ubiquinone/menaquinone biosynthesis C-methylase UbiE